MDGGAGHPGVPPTMFRDSRGTGGRLQPDGGTLDAGTGHTAVCGERYLRRASHPLNKTLLHWETTGIDNTVPTHGTAPGLRGLRKHSRPNLEAPMGGFHPHMEPFCR